MNNLYEIHIGPFVTSAHPQYRNAEKMIKGCEPTEDINSLHRKVMRINSHLGMTMVHISPVYNH